MDGAQILIAGVGGLGCSWAKRAHSRTGHGIDLVLIDADESSFDYQKPTLFDWVRTWIQPAAQHFHLWESRG